MERSLEMKERKMLHRLPRLLTVLGCLALAGAAPVPGAAAETGDYTATGDPEVWANPTPEQPEVVLVQGATIWTGGPDGTLEVADLLIRRGEIVRVGQDLSAPAGAVVIDGTGKHVTAGLIDCHSHTAIDGGVNEVGELITAEVGIEDVIDPEDVNIYRQLAGGLTAANLLHGSSNPIGGKNAVIKLRWGSDAEGLLLDGAPPGIKFALGENPKQSNFETQQARYPQTRMGVEQAIRSAFLAAENHRRELQTAGGADRVPPRPDHQADALLEILDGKRLVHAHSYRADEILMLLRLAENLGFRVATFQHVLEGYKVADEIAAHGAGASTFSDWWAYKMEVIDAIPYNGTLMTNRGVVVSFNSDSSELARRLNLEAAKAVRYGGLPEEEALKLVTLNPAIQLGIEDRVGSLEPGKDADFVIWSGHPLSVYSIAEQTWVDGRKYFDREEDLRRREELRAERQALIERIREEEKKEEDAGEDGEEEPDGESEETPEGTDEPPRSALGHGHGPLYSQAARQEVSP